MPDRRSCAQYPRCVYPEPPSGAQPTRETAGVLNAITSAVASLQAADALKILAGRGELVETRSTTLDVRKGGIRQIAGPPRGPDCPTSRRCEFPFLEESSRPPVRLGGRNAVRIRDAGTSVDLDQLRARLDPLSLSIASASVRPGRRSRESPDTPPGACRFHRLPESREASYLNLFSPPGSQNRSISSRLRPLVSGTIRQTIRNVTTHMLE